MDSMKDYVIKALSDRDVNLVQLSKDLKMNRGKIYRIKAGEDTSYSAMEALYNHFRKQKPEDAANILDYKDMVNRFLSWKLPDDFYPDCGISFTKESEYEHPVYGKHIYNPIGTNLFHAGQAEEMFRHCVKIKSGE
jgi:hypothetical protein